ncbi:uncharacterized protein LOC100186486 isoform X1 [Ciona intestinalis]
MALVFAASELGRSQDSNESPKLIRYRKIMIFLGLSEIFVGSISILLGILQVALVRPSSSSISSNTSPQSYGEGIWAGIWVVVAGVLCTAAAKTKTKLWLIQTHLGFAIAGAISAAIEITISVILSLPKKSSPLGAGLAVIGAFALVFCIVGASITTPFYNVLTGSHGRCSACCCCAEYGNYGTEQPRQDQGIRYSSQQPVVIQNPATQFESLHHLEQYGAEGQTNAYVNPQVTGEKAYPSYPQSHFLKFNSAVVL